MDDVISCTADTAFQLVFLLPSSFPLSHTSEKIKGKARLAIYKMTMLNVHVTFDL